MAYTKQTWSDLPSKTTPINASRLGHIEQGIYDAAATADNASTAISAMGTAVSKNSTNAVTQNSGDLVESGAVYTAIANAKASCYKPSGDKTCAELVAGLLVQSNLGNVYNITDSGTTTSDFVGGAGKPISVGDNVAIVDVGSSVYKFDLLTGMVDLSDYQTKALSAQVEGQSTVEGALGALSDADQATRQLIDDTVGWESYNEFTPSLSGSYDKGVTLVINANKTISLSGTATMTHVLNVGKFVCKANTEYILSGCPSGGGTGASNYWLGAYIINDISDDRKDIGNGCTFSFNVDTEITIKYRMPNGYVATGVTLYPMITKTIYKGFPYRPYHASVDESKVDNTVIAPVEDGTTASQAYSANDFFIHLGELYIATTSIAQGATFTVGTNCTKKTVGEILTALLNA